MKKELIINYSTFKLSGRQFAVYVLLMLFFCGFNNQSLLAQYDQTSIWKDVIETGELSIKYQTNPQYLYNAFKTEGAIYNVPPQKDG